MNYQAKIPILDLEGQPIEDEKGRPFTLQTLLVRTATANDPQKLLTGQEKFDLYVLATGLSSCDPDGILTLSIEEIALLKDRAGRVWLNPMIVGRLWDVLNNPVKGVN